jgi:high-affinity iron transporter
MARNLFSIPIFFIVFRETLEAAIIVSVLLGLVEQIVHEDGKSSAETSAHDTTGSTTHPVVANIHSVEAAADDSLVQKRRLVRKLRIQVRLNGWTHIPYIISHCRYFLEPGLVFS